MALAGELCNGLLILYAVGTLLATAPVLTVWKRNPHGDCLPWLVKYIVFEFL